LINSKYRIAGYDSSLAKEYPDVADALDAAGKDLSKTCYECIKLSMRVIGICPKTRNEIRDFLAVISNLNKYGVIPGINVTEPQMKGLEGKKDNDKESGVTPNGKQVKWNNPDMEEEFI